MKKKNEECFLWWLPQISNEILFSIVVVFT